MFTSLWLHELRSRLFGVRSRNNGRKTTPASVRRPIRPCLERLEDRLAPAADSVQTVAATIPASFSASSQSVTLTATVKDTTNSSTTVNTGTVTFTVDNSSGTPITGTTNPVQGTVSNGTAGASFTLPADEPAGNYTIKVAYSDGTDFTDGGDTAGTLAVAAASTTTAAQDATTAFSSSAQNVTLNATVTSGAGTVNEGSVTFTILQGTTVIGTATSGTVSNGSASVNNYSLPAGTDAGSYTINASYSDSSGSGNFAPSSNNSHHLTVTSATAAATTTAASNATATFSSSAQNVTLNATVTSSGGTVNEGSVTFTILKGTTVIGTATSGTVSNGSASVSNYSLPAGTAPGTYTIEANYSDSTGKFAISSDTSHTLTVSASTTTAAQNATATFNSSAQNVTLNATVTSSGGTVNEGSVTFTILKGTTVIGTATSGTVSNGSATVNNYSLPAGTAPGTYTIEASYNDSTGVFTTSSDTSHTLTVSAASTTTAAQNATAIFNSSAQNVTLNATVTSSAGTVNEGSVSFTLHDSNGNTIGTATSGKVTNGSASVSYALPAGIAVGGYTIIASYSDSTGNFANSSDNTHSLTVNGASTTTTASSATTSFSPNPQNVTLNVTVTSSAGTVNEGSVTFTLFDSNGNMIGTPTAGTVSNGSASVSYALPANTPIGSYIITASYSDSALNFSSSSDSSQTLTVSSSTATSLSLTTVSIVPDMSNMSAQVTLTAAVSNSGSMLNEGVLSITLDGVTGKGNVVNGSATVQLTVPLTALLTSSMAALSFSDASGSGNFADANAAQTMATNFWDVLLPSTLTFTADGSEQIEVQMQGQSLLGFSYTAAGLPTQINFSSQSVPVTYANVAGDELVSIGGIPWQINFFNSDGQYQGLATLTFSPDGSPEWLSLNASGQEIGAVPS